VRHGQVVVLLGAVLSGSIGLSLQGCAPATKSIEPDHVPALKYKNHTCPQLADRLIDVNRRLDALSPIQDTASKLDAVALPAAYISVWIPVLFYSRGGHKEELAILKGEVMAVEQSAREKPCPGVIAYIETQREAAASAAAQITQ